VPGEAEPAPIAPDDPEPRPEPEPEPELILPNDPEPRPEAEPALLVVPAGAEVGRDDDEPAPARRSAIPAVLGLMVGLSLVAIIFAASLLDGQDAGERRAAATPSPVPTPRPAAAPRAIPLRAAAGGPLGVTGAVTIAGNDLRFEVEGLDRPARFYEAWLFNDVADARSLGRLDRQPLRLPPDAGRYRFIDVSLEPGENPNHSGRSVLRTDRP